MQQRRRVLNLPVGLSAVAIGYAIREDSALVFFAASVLSFAFWITEASFKELQQGHIRRLKELEDDLSKSGPNETPHPRTFYALKEQKDQHKKEKYLLKKAMKLNHVMYPHVIFTLFGLMAGNILLWHPFLK